MTKQIKIYEIIIKKSITLLIYGKTTFIIGRNDFINGGKDGR